MLANWIQETTATTGTGAVTLAGAVTGHRTVGNAYADGELLPYLITDGNDKESGLGTYTVAGTTLARTHVLETLVAGVYDSTAPAALNLTGNAVVSVVSSAQTNIEYIRSTGAADQVLINEASADLAAGRGGEIRLVDEEYFIAGQIAMHPKVLITGEGFNATQLTIQDPGVAFNVFGFDSTAQSLSANQQSWGLRDLTLFGYGADINTKAIDSKMATYSMQDIRIKGVYFDGFTNGGASAAPVLDILDPWGFRMSDSIIEQTGNRPALRVTANGASISGAMVFNNKIKNNAGDNIIFSGIFHSLIAENELYTIGNANKANIQISGGALNKIVSNGVDLGWGRGLHLTGSTDGNIITGMIVDGDGTSTDDGILIDAGCDGNVIVGGHVNGCTTNFTDNGTNTRMVGLYDGDTSKYLDYDKAVLNTLITPGADTTSDHLDIPSWVTEITINISGISTNNATNFPRLLLGDATSFETANYVGTSSLYNAVTTVVTSLAASFALYDATNWLAGNVIYGSLTLTRLDPATNTWILSGTLGLSNTAIQVVIAGAKTLTGALTRLRLTMDGTDQFDAGSWSVRYKA